ncbi:MAG: 30S ribosomal protein S6 [Chthoniobacterales bacterium]|nr:30S ribosomal protein S6 [Chthoniobacterales bacterium]
MNQYEVLIAIDTRGKEESVKDIIERLEREMRAEGAQVEQVQRLERRELAYKHNHMTHAYYVNFVFRGEPELIDKLRGKFHFDEDVALAQFIRIRKPSSKNLKAA